MGNLATDIAQLVAAPGASFSHSKLIFDPTGENYYQGIRGYWSAVREHWPPLSLDIFERLALVGQIFRMLLEVGWALEVSLIIDPENRKATLPLRMTFILSEL